MGTKGMDKYTRIKQIGEGSFGKALLVRSKENGKQMVVKEINMSKMGYKEREEARKEVAVLAQLGHPNIVSYRESFEEIGNLYIVMDYCDGGDLYSRINAQRGILFGEDVILDWFVQCCLAIKHIHDRKILHRDIKSQNIFLTRHGIVKLGDFGIAKVLNSTVELARTCIGTPYYLSPEICENRPYNNKSDIWSLGCVLYELTTLKHAFEAGNMKNLVLKIIRGSYPAPSPRFSYDLRSLINALFKRSARDRPSITTVLKKPLLQTRIRKFLSESEMASEFSHTVMHGVRLKKALPPGGARPLPPKPVPVQAKRAPTPVKYNPASVYGPSVARKSKERKSVEAKKSVEVRRSAGSAPRKPSAGNAGIAAANNDLVKKRQRLLEEERKRREEARKKDKDAAYAKQHKDLMDKQRMARMNRAREDGWKSVISSGESNDSDMSQTFSVSSLKRSLRRTKIAHGPKKSPYLGSTPRKEEVKKTPPTPVPKAAAAGGGKYDHYHAYLDKLDQDRKAGVKPQPAAQGVRASRDNATPVPGFNPAQAAKQGQVAGARAAMAAGRARDTEDAMAKKRNAAAEEFLNRKRAAAANKARAQRDLLGNAGAAGVAGAISPRRGGPSPYPRPAADRPLSAREQREKQEQDYLAKLKQIRLQNFNERRMQHEHKQGIADPKYKPPVTPDKDQDSRRKKIDALRAQAEDRAKKLKEDLEKKRKEAYDYERKQLKQGAANKPKPSEKPATPAKPVPVTEVMKAIGVSKDEPISVQPIKTPIGMTAAMKAIGAGSDQTAQSPEEDPARASSPLQKKKDDILKRLNSKPPVANKPDRGKWGEPAKPAIQPPSRWGEGDGNVLAGMALEETGSHMDATSAQDKVVKHLDFKEAEEVKDQEDQSGAVVTPRRQWGRPGDTVVNALNQAEISQTDATIHVKGGDSTQATPGGKTVTIPNDKQHKKEVTEQTKPKEVKVPEVTVGHVAGKGTVVIKKTEETSKSSAPDSKDDDTEEEKIILIKLPDDEPSVTESVAMELEPPKQGESKPQSSLFEKVELEDEDDRKSPEKDDTHLEDVEDEKDDEKEPKKEADKSQGIDEDEEKDEEEEEEDREQESKKTLPKQKSAEIVVAGLTTGHFDIDVKMLRTCSEPDLAKLFRTNIAENPFLLAEDDLSASVDIVALEAEMRRQLGQDDDDADDSVLDDLNENGDIGGSSGDGDEEAKDEEGKASDAEKSDASQDSEERKDSEEEEDGEEDGEEDKENEDEDEEDADSDDEDMRTLRESMMNILETEDVDEEEEKLVTSSKKKKKSTKKTKTKSKRKTKTAKEIDEGAELPQQQPGFSRQWSESSVEDLKTLRETMQSLLQPNSQGEKKKATLRAVPEVGGGDADTVDMPSILADMENWQSDGDDDDFFEEEENTFSRLEEKRVHLEQELGCETFLKAYKTVQAIHEDEDENMEEGIQLVSEILGPTQAHHYPAILQLVMADGVFTEDND